MEAVMLEVLVNHLGDVQFEAKARNHVIYSDQPTESGGFDEGMTPPELLLAAMGTCAGYYAVQYLKAQKLPMDGLNLRTTAEKAQAPARLSEIHVFIGYPGPLETRHREGLLQAVRKCVIHNTLLHAPKIDVDIQFAVATPMAA
jgi:putative redox protein